jgi:hypothetical protein
MTCLVYNKSRGDRNRILSQEEKSPLIPLLQSGRLVREENEDESIGG